MTNSTEKSFWRHGMAKWGLFMGFLFAIWFGGWYAAANWADGKLEQIIADVGGRGINIGCSNREIKGFPFRIGVHCDDVEVAHQRDIFKVSTGALRTAAQLYAPGELIAELDGPLVTFPGGVKTTANWSAMRLFLNANFSGGFKRSSLTFKEIKLTAKNLVLASQKGAFHARPTPEDLSNGIKIETDLDLAGNLDGFSGVFKETLRVAGASLNYDISVAKGYETLIVKKRPIRSMLKQGGSVEVRSIVLTVPGEGKIAASGPIQLHSDGTLSGIVTIGVSNARKVALWFAQIDQDLAKAVEGVGQAVSGIGQSEQIGSEKIRAVKIRIDHGNARLGFLPIGKIKPIIVN